MATDPQAIAASLTKAQRQAIFSAAPRQWGDEELFLPVYRDAGRLVQSIYDLGLATIVMRGVMLNAAGIAVRSLLSEDRP